MAKRVVKRSEREEGQGLLEFSLVAVLMFMLIFGIIDFGRLFFAYATMSNGVREGARYGIIHPNEDADIEARAQAMLVILGGEAEIQVNYPGGDDLDEEPPGCIFPHRCRIEVVATSVLDVWTPILPALPLEARATMHFE
ncbi:MAG: pilus assembly protein [Planctomycetaceae bacterium]|nr:MAG: pilus assembly protein [Planctomycetaceae bacterium]